MPILIPTFLSYLLIIGPARAQITVPNCTDPTLAWVGYLRTLILYQSQYGLTLFTGNV